MSQALPSPLCCPATCDESVNVAVPGPQGEPGADGTNGTDGLNAFTSLAASFVQPTVGNNVTLEVTDSSWMTIGQDIFVENGGYYQVISKADTTHATVKNLGYTANVAPTTVVPNASHVSPAGEKGEDGSSDLSTVLLKANNLSDLVSAATARTNLGGTTVGKNLFILTNPGAITFLRVNSDNTVTALSAANFRTALSLVPGTDVQVFDAFLTSIAALGTTANRMIYTTATNVAAETVLTAFARTLLDDADEATARATLGNLLPRYGLLASKLAMDLNSAGSDNAMTVESSRYRIDRITFDNASVNLTTATAGVFTAAGGGGTTLAADQPLSALTASSKFKDLTLDAGVGTDVVTAGTIYARNGTAQTAPATADVRVFGWSYS